MPQPSNKEGFSFGAVRELILPATLLVCFGLYYGAHKPFELVVAVALPMVALYALAPAWARSSMAEFDRDAVRLLATGRAQALIARYETAFGMRLFAPPALCAERKAMALAEAGKTEAAREAFKEALDEHGAVAPLRVMLGYAHTSFALGDDAAAIPMYRRLLESAATLPGVERHLAHALVRRGEDLEQALALLDRAPREPDATLRAEHTLLRALAFAKLGQRDRARSLLEEVGDGERPELRALVLAATQ